MHDNWQVRWEVSGVLFWWSYFLCEVGDYDLKIQIEEEGGGRVRDFMEYWIWKHAIEWKQASDRQDMAGCLDPRMILRWALKILFELETVDFTPSRFTQHSLYNSWEFRQFEFSRIVIFANWVQWKNKESTNRCICEKSFIEIKEKKAVIREE